MWRGCRGEVEAGNQRFRWRSPGGLLAGFGVEPAPVIPPPDRRTEEPQREGIAGFRPELPESPIGLCQLAGHGELYMLVEVRGAGHPRLRCLALERGEASLCMHDAVLVEHGTVLWCGSSKVRSERYWL